MQRERRRRDKKFRLLMHFGIFILERISMPGRVKVTLHLIINRKHIGLHFNFKVGAGFGDILPLISVWFSDLSSEWSGWDVDEWKAYRALLTSESQSTDRLWPPANAAFVSLVYPKHIFHKSDVYQKSFTMANCVFCNKHMIYIGWWNETTLL